MGKNYRFFEWKTMNFLALSVMVHAGIVYYISRQVGLNSNGSSQVHTNSNVSETKETTTTLEVRSETPTKVSTDQPTDHPVGTRSQKNSEPKIEVIRPESSKPKPITVLPKKNVILPAPTNENPKSQDIPVVVAVKEDTQVSSAVHEVAKNQFMDSKSMQNNGEAPSVATEKVERIDVEKAISREKTVQEQLVEQILKDEMPEETTSNSEEQIPVKELPPEKAHSVQTQAQQTHSVQSQFVQSDAALSRNRESVNGSLAQVEDTPTNLPIKNEFELRPMPGNKIPEYSEADRLARRQGEVKFMAKVSATGEITDIRLLKSSGHRSLDLAAYKAFKNYRYYPGQPSYVIKSFVFRLTGPVQTLPSSIASRQKSEAKSKN